jgi:hypothetical protein
MNHSHIMTIRTRLSLAVIERGHTVLKTTEIGCRMRLNRYAGFNAGKIGEHYKVFN